MAKSKTAVRSGKSARSNRFKKLPVPVSNLRRTLMHQLAFAVLVGFFLGRGLMYAFKTGESGLEPTALTVGGMGLSCALYLGIIWLRGRNRRAAFAASGGDPNAAGVLLFGVMASRTVGRGRGRGNGSGGQDGYAGSDSGGDGGCGDGGGDGGGGGGCD